MTLTTERRPPKELLEITKTPGKRPLEERGVTPETFSEFQITTASDEICGTFYNFPTFHADGTPGRRRRIFHHPAQAGTTQKPQKYSWGQGESDGIPPGYGAERIKPGAEVWVVSNEPSVWLCFQEGIAAICSLGEGRNPRPMLEVAKHSGAASVRVLLNNDAIGRQATVRAVSVAREIALPITAHEWPESVRDGYDAADLWEQCQREGRDFRTAVQALPQHAPSEPSSHRQTAPTEQLTATSASAIPDNYGQRFPETPTDRIPVPMLRPEGDRPEYDTRQLVEYPHWQAAALLAEKNACIDDLRSQVEAWRLQAEAAIRTADETSAALREVLKAFPPKSCN